MRSYSHFIHVLSIKKAMWHRKYQLQFKINYIVRVVTSDKYFLTQRHQISSILICHAEFFIEEKKQKLFFLFCKNIGPAMLVCRISPQNKILSLNKIYTTSSTAQNASNDQCYCKCSIVLNCKCSYNTDFSCRCKHLASCA